MAVTFSRIVGPFGNDVHFSDGMAKVGYKVVGDGVGGAINLPFHKLASVISVLADQIYNPVIDNANKQVTLTIPAALANGTFVEVWLQGKGGH
jgi:hypothetical protein